jgi:hypothetical protein
MKLEKILAETLFTKLTQPKTSKELVKIINEKLPLINTRYRTEHKNISDIKLRNVINTIRMEDLLPNGFKLLANSQGYFISNDKEEIHHFIKSLSGRVDAINRAIAGLEKTIDESSDLFDQF